MVWIGRDLKDHLFPTPFLWAGTHSTTPGFSKPHPIWPWTLPGMEHPQLLWVTCSNVSLSQWRISSQYLMYTYSVSVWSHYLSTYALAKSPSPRTMESPQTWENWGGSRVEQFVHMQTPKHIINFCHFKNLYFGSLLLLLHPQMSLKWHKDKTFMAGKITICSRIMYFITREMLAPQVHKGRPDGS